MSYLKRLREALFGTPKEPVDIKEGRAILGAVEQAYGVRLSTNFKSQVDVYNKDPVLKQEILQIATEIISTGIFSTVEDDSLILSNKKPKQAIDEWNRLNDLDNKILLIATELVAFGNSFWNISEGGFVNIPIEAIEQAVPSSKKIPIRDEYKLKTTASYGSITLEWGTFIHFRINTTGLGVFGSGIILGLVATPDNDTPSFWELRKSIRRSMKEGFEKFSFGNELWSFEGMADDKIEEIGKKVAKMNSTGQRIATNVKGDIRLAVPQRTQSYDKWIEQIDKEFYVATGGGISPNTEYTTRATAEAVRELFEMRVISLRRVIKRQIEELWTKVLNKLGYDGLKVNAKLHFGSQEIEYTTADVFAAKDKGIISVEEARKILREYMKWRLESKLPEEVKEDEPAKEIEE